MPKLFSRILNFSCGLYVYSLYIFDGFDRVLATIFKEDYENISAKEYHQLAKMIFGRLKKFWMNVVLNLYQKNTLMFTKIMYPLHSKNIYRNLESELDDLGIGAMIGLQWFMCLTMNMKKY